MVDGRSERRYKVRLYRSFVLEHGEVSAKEFVNISELRSCPLKCTSLTGIKKTRGETQYQTRLRPRGSSFPSRRTYFMRLSREIIASVRDVQLFSNFGHRSVEIGPVLLQQIRSRGETNLPRRTKKVT